MRDEDMATIQARMCRGHKYWYIVESRRVNGKPRPIVIECLGPTEKLIARLQNTSVPYKVKSFSHGAVAAFLALAKKLDVVSIINKHTCSQREYWPEQPIRNDLTAGITLLLAAIGRACMPTSKQGWHDWAKTTSCDQLLRISLAKLDSQHFWDLMDCILEKAIEEIELEILQKVLESYPLNEGTLLYDTTNFYTFINSTNDRCEIAQRGKNKQKRNDLRQVGLALAVTQEHYIPLLHNTYKGNINDSKVFGKVIISIKKRMEKLKMDVSQHTIVFDRGCNSKVNLNKVKRLKLHYVGALTPYHHQDLIEAAEGKFIKTQVGTDELDVYREKRMIWGEERTVLVFISRKLQDGQLRGVHQSLEKRRKRLRKIQQGLASPRAKKRTKKQLEQLLQKVLQGQFMEGLITYELKKLPKGRWSMTYRTNRERFEELEDELGFRIVMTNRHDWESDKIIKTFYGQAIVEQAFKNIKNPYHLAVTPQFHWTDHKIKIHYLICVLGYLLSALIWHDARKAGFCGTLDNLLDALNDIRLSRHVEISNLPGKSKVIYQLEEMSDEQQAFLQTFNISDIHLKPLKIEGVSVYKSKAA
jgi:transposase